MSILWIHTFLCVSGFFCKCALPLNKLCCGWWHCSKCADDLWKYKICYWYSFKLKIFTAKYQGTWLTLIFHLGIFTSYLLLAQGSCNCHYNNWPIDLKNVDISYTNPECQQWRMRNKDVAYDISISLVFGQPSVSHLATYSIKGLIIVI